ncbi:hypothetical protein [Planktothricoides raciborskii]|uniref:Uncharacterized protein n=2 Tax=Planktothricoides raciborskii TaxID=132608 RepID=A0AAU8JN65_9CYAN|nr:hypothetical protein [Planktothricoides raciborskii]MBD2547785.1 hypothetical protein [Planktothricoides raciborskii FACHB-1370]MBD2586208.1 hypothetical protein [Planktothricoides raciborskii FACHB-1261]
MGDRVITPMPGRSISADKLSEKTKDLWRKCFAPTGCFICDKMRRFVLWGKERSLFCQIVER